MSIEPINTIATAQMPVAKNNGVEVDTSAEKRVTPVDAPKPDATTNVVENAKDKGRSQSDGREENQQQTNEKIKTAVENFNKNYANSEAVYGIHEGTNRVTIKIVDKNTKAVIKELPPEKTLDMIARVWEMAGILVDEKR